MLTKENFLKVTSVIFTAAALLFFAFYQYLAYQTDIKTTRQQLNLVALHDRITYLDKSLTMSTRLYILTGDELWRQRYKEFEAKHNASIAEIYELLGHRFNGQKELQSAMSELSRLEVKAFELISLHRREEARLIIGSDEYRHQKTTYETGLTKLSGELDEEVQQFIAFHRSLFLKNTLVIGAIFLLIFLGWFLFARISRKWRNKIIAAERQLAEEAMSAENTLQKANSRLQLLSGHLLEVREKERFNLAYDLNEELGQQIAAVKLKVTTLQQQLSFPGQAQAAAYQEIEAQLGQALNFLRNLASDAYPLVLRDLGLIEALEWESNRVAEQCDITITFSSEVEELKWDQRIATIIFRIYQEKISHLAISGATEIFALLRIEEDHLGLRIFDNLNKSPEWELIEDVAIEERLRMVKGVLETHCAEEGNQFVVLLPYNEKQM